MLVVDSGDGEVGDSGGRGVHFLNGNGIFVFSMRPSSLRNLWGGRADSFLGGEGFEEDDATGISSGVGVTVSAVMSSPRMILEVKSVWRLKAGRINTLARELRSRRKVDVWGEEREKISSLPEINGSSMLNL